MRISDAEVKKILSNPGSSIVDAIEKVAVENIRQQDKQLVKAITQDVMAMQDREEMVAELRAQIAAGLYNPSGEEIVDAMVRRAVADQYKQRD